MTREVLVIGCGSRLRSDDGIGIHVAEAVTRRRPEGVSARAVHQLVPELAEAVAAAAAVIFVDAGVPGAGRGVRVAAVWPEDPGAEGASVLGHGGSPAALLSLARALFGRAPEAYLVSAPAPSLAFGDRLSPAGVVLARRTLREVMRLIDDHQRRLPPRRPRAQPAA